MKCSKCNTEMELSGNFLMCPICGHKETTVKIVQRPPYKLDWTKVDNWDELLLLLNEIDLHVGSSHPKYDELKRFSF